MTLSASGLLAGKPKSAGTSSITVHATDWSTPPQVAQRTYTLRVLAPGAAKPASSAASAPQKVTDVVIGGEPPSSNAASVMSYKLQQADLDDAIPEAPAGGDASAGGDEAQAASASASAPAPALDATQAQLQGESDPVLVKQQRAMLKPLLEQEFPTRAMFERALEMRACSLARDVVMQAEKAAGLPPKAEAITCPPMQAASAPKQAASGAKIPVAQLPAYLLPGDVRDKLVAKAAKPHKLASAPIAQWDGGDCGCGDEDLAGDVYGFYPFWVAGAAPQPVNFALRSAIAYHAATFTDDGGVIVPDSWDEAAYGIALNAHRHNTRLDLAIWRGDWSGLPRDDASIDRVAAEFARGAMQAIDPPHVDHDGGWKRLVQ